MSLINESMTTQTFGCGVAQIMMSTTADSCSVATLSSESLQNVGEKPSHPNRFLFLK